MIEKTDRVIASVMGDCAHCGEPTVEIGRNDLFVFYRCGCNRNKGADYDWRTRLLDGVEYCLGSAGSFVQECPACHNRLYRLRITRELCVHCAQARVEPVVIVAQSPA